MVNLDNEEETNDKDSSKKVSKKVSKTKLFSFDKLYEAEKKVPAGKEDENGKADDVQEIKNTKVKAKLLKEGNQIDKTSLKEEKKEGKKTEDAKVGKKKERLTKEISQLEQTSSFDKNQDQLNIRQELKTGTDRKITEASADVKTDSGESIKVQAQEMNIKDENLKQMYDELTSQILCEDTRDTTITKMIFAMDNPSQVLYNLGLSFDAMLTRKKKNLLIVCALQKLKSMQYYSFTPYLEMRLHDFLVKSSWISMIPLTDLLKILEFFLMVSSRCLKVL